MSWCIWCLVWTALSFQDAPLTLYPPIVDGSKDKSDRRWTKTLPQYSDCINQLLKSSPHNAITLGIKLQFKFAGTHSDHNGRRNSVLEGKD